MSECRTTTEEQADPKGQLAQERGHWAAGNRAGKAGLLNTGGAQRIKPQPPNAGQGTVGFWVYPDGLCSYFDSYFLTIPYSLFWSGTIYFILL